MILGLDHIEICVGDIDAAADFFKKMGFTEVRRTEHHNGAVEMLVPHSNIILEFHKGLNTETPGLNHIAFLVDDMDKTYADFADAGVKFDAPPKIAGNRGCKIVSLRDPAHMRYQFVDQPSGPNVK